MAKEKYIKPIVKMEALEAEVLTTNHGSPNGENPTGGLTAAGWQWKKNWH